MNTLSNYESQSAIMFEDFIVGNGISSSNKGNDCFCLEIGMSVFKMLFGTIGVK